MKVDIHRLLRTLGIKVDKPMHGNLWALCPYPGHKESHPSWSIDEKTGQNYCFGCESGGSALDLIIAVVDLSGYSAAFRWITEHNLDLEGTSPLAVSLVCRKQCLKSLQIPNGLKSGKLSDWVTPPRRYVTKRGITDEQIRKWSIHYGVGGDLNGRIFIPIFDNNGILLSYNSRSYIDQEPRYLKPSSGGLPGAVFGEKYWDYSDPNRELVLCEGEFNGLACERAGVRYIGALSGSSIDKEQILKLGHFKSIIVASDLDVAGNKLAIQLKMILVRWANVKRVNFPSKLDANDIAIKDINWLRDLINGAT